jgi:hypothetical protein
MLCWRSLPGSAPATAAAMTAASAENSSALAALPACIVNPMADSWLTPAAAIMKGDSALPMHA